MNIFFLDLNQRKCAKWHVDKHVIKMILESVQLLCSAHHIFPNKNNLYSPPYKLTHKNHPCSKWVRESLSNYKWLIKLAKELSKRSTGRTLYILDEPTTGLHADDVSKLLKVLHKLVDLGNTALVIEHNLDVIKTADYIIDVGPEGGEKGGRIVGEGSPAEIVRNPESITGYYLKDYYKI